MGYDSKATWSGDVVRGRNSRPTRTERRARTEAGTLSVSGAIDDFLEAAERGAARDRYGRGFTDDAVAELHWCLAGYVSEELGAMSLNEVRRKDVERLLYELGDSGIAERRLRAVAKAVRALYDYAVERGLVRGNPAERVALPADDEVDQPTRRGRPSTTQRLWASADRKSGGGVDGKPRAGADRTLWARADRLLSLGLQLATFGLLIVALILIVESL